MAKAKYEEPEEREPMDVEDALANPDAMVESMDEDRGYTSTKGPICSHCAKAIPVQHCGAGGTVKCPHCKKESKWAASNTPVGFAWTTWRRVDKGK
jgi:hypothetical protein